MQLVFTEDPQLLKGTIHPILLWGSQKILAPQLLQDNEATLLAFADSGQGRLKEHCLFCLLVHGATSLLALPPLGPSAIQDFLAGDGTGIKAK